MLAYQDILAAAKTLGSAERWQLVDELIVTLNNEELANISPALQEELQRRNELLEQGKLKLFTWKEVRDQARRKVGFNG